MWKKHHRGTVQIAYAASKQQLPHFINILQILSYNFNNFNHFVTSASPRLRLPEDDADALKHLVVLTIYKIYY